MINQRNAILTYRVATEDMLESAGFKSELASVTYDFENEEKEIVLSEEHDYNLLMHGLEPNWSPSENNLVIKQKFIFKNPNVFFGDEGITSRRNKIGIAAHIYSKTTNYQKKINFGVIKYNDFEKTLYFIHEFEKNSLRGELNIDYFLYLEEANENLDYQAMKKGMRLSINLLQTTTIVIDGIGSIFPIVEIDDKTAPLWQIEKNWVDPIDESFDSSTVQLKLNIAHQEFKRIRAGHTILSRLYMGDIIIQAMAAIIDDVINKSEYNLNDVDDVAHNSIISVVKYWIETFEVDTTDYFNIVNTLKLSLEDNFR